MQYFFHFINNLTFIYKNKETEEPPAAEATKSNFIILHYNIKIIIYFNLIRERK